MSDYVIDAELREKTGKAETRRLRKAGKIPGIIYGGGKPDLPILLDFNSTSKLLNEEHFHSSIVEINVAGSRGKNSVLLKDAQWDPIMDTAKHLDFMRVSSSDTVHMEVHVVPVNHEKCPGIKAGGLLDIVRHSLEVTCRADSIPEHIEIDCSNMEIGDTVHIEDITLPDGVTVAHDVNFTVLNLTVAKKAEVEEAAEEGAAEAAEATEEATEATEE